MPAIDLKNNSQTRRAIVETIAFFDMFDYPLTVFEIFKYLKINCDLAYIINFLENNSLKGIEKKDGFYFLVNRKNIIEERKKRYNYTNKKIKRAVFVIKIFKIIPWIKMVFLGNILGAHNLKKESDIDLFIITAKNRIWITRFFSVLIIMFLGLRPTSEKKRDKICLSFLVSEEKMNLKELMLDMDISKNNNSIFFDIYFVHWLACLVPLYGRKKDYQKFIENNSWILFFLPNFRKENINPKRNAGKGFSILYYELADVCLGGAEKMFKKIQLKKMPKNLKNLAEKKESVIISDSILKFHTNDRRKEYSNNYFKKIKEYDFIEKDN